MTAAEGRADDPRRRVLPHSDRERGLLGASHMTLLNDWRDSVVREGQRVHTSSEDGKTYLMSLTKTCMACHLREEGDADELGSAQYCGECHEYTGVDTYCWDCHIDPKEME